MIVYAKFVITKLSGIDRYLLFCGEFDFNCFVLLQEDKEFFLSL